MKNGNKVRLAELILGSVILLVFLMFTFLVKSKNPELTETVQILISGVLITFVGSKLFIIYTNWKSDKKV